MSVGLAACVALYVHRYCVANGVDACDAAVEVVPIWRADPGRIARFEVLLHLPETVSEHVAAQLEEIARECPVHHTLGERAEIEVRVVTGARELETSRSSAA
jgi:uncharacterized OsmC-like protein